jgi:protein-S-isoprenylcysteine O-methyltransferase Ste14
MNTLSQRAAARTAGFLFLLGGLTFVSAGTIHFWQGWLFWPSFWVSVVAGALLLIFAIPIALGSWWGLLTAAISPPLLIARILDEEHALSAELAGCDNYRRAVPYRLIPLV